MHVNDWPGGTAVAGHVIAAVAILLSEMVIELAAVVFSVVLPVFLTT